MQLRKLLRVAHPTHIIAKLLIFSFLLPFLSIPLTYADPGDETTYYLLTDHLGSVDVVLDDQGEVVERRDYLPYGQERYVHEELNAPKTDQGFTGKELDNETGLNYYGARYYDAEIGRFTSIDPLVLDEAKTTDENLMAILKDPQKLNAYTYALNNPLKYLDPFGESLRNAFQGTFKMIEGSAKVVLGALGLIRYPKAPTKQGAGATMGVKGLKDIQEGFQQAATDTEPQPSFQKKAVETGIKTVMGRKLPFFVKQIYSQIYNFDLVSKGAGYVGGKLDDVASNLGDESPQQEEVKWSPTVNTNGADAGEYWTNTFKANSESAKLEEKKDNDKKN